jgi:hypothetical protein
MRRHFYVKAFVSTKKSPGSFGGAEEKKKKKKKKKIDGLCAAVWEVLVPFL